MTAALGSTIVVYEQDNGLSRPRNSSYMFKEIMVETPATADNGDTFNITLANYGITNIKSIMGFRHTTNNDVILTGTATTSVSSGVLQVVIGGSHSNDKMVYVIGGY